MKNLAGMMKQAQAMQQKMAEMQQQLKDAQAKGYAEADLILRAAA